MINAPSWCRHAVPSPKGWVDSRTGELLKAVGLSDAQISEWCEARAPKKSKKVEVEEAPVEDESEEDDQ